MPLDIPTNQSELNELAEALESVSERQPSASGILTFLRYSDRAKQLAHALTFATLNDPAQAVGFADNCDTLAGVCGALRDHVVSTEGSLFWKGKKALLLGLADHFHDLAEQARNRPGQDLLNLL